MNEAYLKAVRLLLKVAPSLFESDVFALKGGTAINLFLRDLPRLSVDLDLVYRKHTDTRSEALRTIQSELGRIESRVRSLGLSCEKAANLQGDEVKLFVSEGRTRIKVEVNYVFRGTLRPVTICSLHPSAEEQFLMELEIPLLAREEIYGGKIVAALDRQHPRDLFDLKGLYEEEGLNAGVVECVVCYLAGHNRPLHEVLFAKEADIAAAYENEFNGMTREPVELQVLLGLRRRLFSELPAALTHAHRKFLFSLAAAEPDWDLMGCAHLRELPAIRWKLHYLERLRTVNPRKFEDQTNRLRAAFDNRDDS